MQAAKKRKAGRLAAPGLIHCCRSSLPLATCRQTGAWTPTLLLPPAFNVSDCGNPCAGAHHRARGPRKHSLRQPRGFARNPLMSWDSGKSHANQPSDCAIQEWFVNRTTGRGRATRSVHAHSMSRAHAPRMRRRLNTTIGAHRARRIGVFRAAVRRLAALACGANATGSVARGDLRRRLAGAARSVKALQGPSGRQGFD